MTNGELVFIEWLRGRNPAPPSIPVGIGDDCAVLRVGDHDVLMTTDILLDGTHFDSRQHSPEQIGRKSVACSLSDIAAMAGRPVGAVVGVALRSGCGIEFAQRMFDGMKAIADQYRCPIVGGDTTSWSQPAAVCVTMLGQCPPGRAPVLRSGAKVGDTIYVTGPLGGSLLGRHLTFEPRIELADEIAGRLDLHAMMDISDGLAIDLWRVCRASGVGAILDERQVENVISDDARRLSAGDGISPLDHALHDGEDFELLVVMPEQVISAELSGSLHAVGRIAETGFVLRRLDEAVAPLEPRGYEHKL
jgi:thiamine-monophosphate kinase